MRFAAEDLVLTLDEGAAFPLLAGEQPTGLVLVGKGSLSFMPPVRSEQRQLALFSGSIAPTFDLDRAYVRFHPADFEFHVAPAVLREASAPGPLRRRAEKIFDEEAEKSFAAPSEPRGPSLSTLPPRGDFLAEVRTLRHGRLACARIGAEPEDILLIDRERGLQIASYPSRERRNRSGFEYGDEAGLPYEALDYEVEVEVDPDRALLSGRASVTLRAIETFPTASLRLDSDLSVSAVRSADRGPHQFRRAPGDVLLVRLDPPLAAGERIRIETAFEGRVPGQDLSRPTTRGSAGGKPAPRAGGADFLLLSNRVYWFPQSPARNHTPGKISVTLPEGWTALASGIGNAPVSSGAERRRFVFRIEKPVRYLSLLVGKFRPLADSIPRGGEGQPVRVVAAGRPGLAVRAAVSESAEVLRFYTALVGERPYPDLSVALLETPAPAGHSPAYFTILGEPADWNPRAAPADPTYFADEPVFSLAHEIAHQWWGQAVGWRNYREQWLSEGLAQYFAALYLRESRGAEVFERALAWMSRWALEGAGKGPISLGVRAGEATRCATCFAAIVYNRGALVLHMLRGLLGEEAFLRGLRLYYERWKFRRAGTEDLRRAFEEAPGIDLGRFFEQWVRDDGVPDLAWSAEEIREGQRPRLRLRVEQTGETFELPLSVSIEYRDRAGSHRIVPVRAGQEEFLIDLEGSLRRVRVNRDFAALCRLRERR